MECSSEEGVEPIALTFLFSELTLCFFLTNPQEAVGGDMPKLVTAITKSRPDSRGCYMTESPYNT
jgi:hypothetical protein